MKKILTLMAAMAAAGSMMAHDYKWEIASAQPDTEGTADADGFKLVKNCFGSNLKFKTSNEVNTFKFTANGGDKIFLDVTGDNTKLTVTAGNTPLDITIENGKPTFSVAGDADIDVTITLEEGTVVTGITVESKSYREVGGEEGLVKKTNDILDARVNNISKYVNLEGKEDRNNKFYLAVRALINAEGAKLTQVSELLQMFKEKDLMDSQIDAAALEGFITSATADNTSGKAYIESLLEEIKKAIGTAVTVNVNGKDEEKEKEKGSILVKAEEAYKLYAEITGASGTTLNQKVQDALEIITNEPKEGSEFYTRKNILSNWEERWTVDNTPSKTNALELFAKNVTTYYNTQVDSALDALNKFEDLTDLKALSDKFDKVKTYSDNLKTRYEYEAGTDLYQDENGKNEKGITNYAAINQLSDDVENMDELAKKGYKKADGTDLFDVTGLDDLKTKGLNLFTKISSEKNKHTISNMKSNFGTPYGTIKTSIDSKKKNWGKAAQSEIKTKYEAAQTRLSGLENTITTKYQNDADSLKAYQAKFAEQQVIINAVKDAVSDVSTAAAAYKVANDYKDNFDKLTAVEKSLDDLWKGTQNAENTTIIDKNTAALKALKDKKDELDNTSNAAVAKLSIYRNDKFFKNEEALQQTIAENIKTIYDYSTAVKAAYKEADEKVKECNKQDVVDEKVESVIADLSEYETTIDTNKKEIEDALAKALDEVNEYVKKHFDNALAVYDKQFGHYKYNNYIAKQLTAAENEAKDNVAISKEENDNTITITDGAFADAKDLFVQAIEGQYENGKLVTSDKDIANAKARLEVLYKDEKKTALADDVVEDGANSIMTIVSNAHAEANDILAKFKKYAGYKKDLYDIEVEWSVNHAVAVKENDPALTAKLDSLHETIKTNDDNLTNTYKLDVKDDFEGTVNTLKSEISLTKNSTTFKAYADITKAKEAAETQIADAKTAYEELTKDTAKKALKEAIDAAQKDLESADAGLKSSLAEGTFSGEAETLLKQYKGIDLTEAVNAAKEAEKVVPGDQNNDGVLNEKDLITAKMKLDAETMTDDDYIEFLSAYKAYLLNKN